MPTNRTISKAARLRMADAESIHARFAQVGAAGFGGVDVIVPDDVPVAELLDAREQTGVAIANVLAGRSRTAWLADPDAEVRAHAVEGLVLGLHAAATLDSSSVMLPSLAPAGLSEAQAVERTRRELAPVLEVAGDVGVLIAVENCWDGFLQSAEALATFVDSFETPWIAIHFDVGNVSPIGRPEDWIPVLADRIHKIDLKDYDRERAERGGIPHGQELELGEGDCNWLAVAEALRRSGYAGWVSAEVPGSGPALLERMSAAIDRIFAL